MTRPDNTRLTGAAIACELFKVLRGQWLTRAEIAQQLPLSDMATARWVAEFHAQGMLVERLGPKPAVGYAPRQYTLAREWGGAAA